MEPNFCLANVTDIDILIDFMRQFYAIDDYPFEEAAARKAMQTIVQDSSLGRVWLINNDTETVGYIVLTFGFSLEYRGRDAFIDEFFVLAPQRNQGIGSKTIEFVLAACHDLDIRALHLEVERTNIAGLALYQKFGFENHDRFLMTRWIAS